MQSLHLLTLVYDEGVRWWRGQRAKLWIEGSENEAWSNHLCECLISRSGNHCFYWSWAKLRHCLGSAWTQINLNFTYALVDLASLTIRFISMACHNGSISDSLLRRGRGEQSAVVEECRWPMGDNIHVGKPSDFICCSVLQYKLRNRQSFLLLK